MTIVDLLPYLDNETRYFIINEQGVIISPGAVSKKDLTPFIDLWVFNVAADPVKVGVICIFVTKR